MSPLGHFVWYDLLTTDVDNALAFYGAVAGWTPQPWKDHYTMLMIGERPVGGAMVLPEQAKAMGAPPHWTVYVQVADVEAAIEKAKGLGASVLAPPMDMESVGRMAVIADPQGASISLFAPLDPDGMPIHKAKVGDFSWHELNTTDSVAAWAFYEELFGWQKGDVMETPAGPYQLFMAGERGGGMGDMAKMLSTPMWLLYIRVANLEAAVEQVKAHGGELLNGPMDVPGGDRIVQCRDPQGVMFALHSGAK